MGLRDLPLEPEAAEDLRRLRIGGRLIPIGQFEKEDLK